MFLSGVPHSLSRLTHGIGLRQGGNQSKCERCTAVFCAWPWGPLGEKQQKIHQGRNKYHRCKVTPPNSERAPREHHGGTAGAPREHCSRGAPAVNNIACVLGGVADRAPPFLPFRPGRVPVFQCFHVFVSCSSRIRLCVSPSFYFIRILLPHATKPLQQDEG